MSSKLREFIASLEGIENGEKAPEIEHCFICKIEDFDQLKKADRVEKQEQYEIRTKPDGDNNGVKGLVRIRAVDDKKYVLTTKVHRKRQRGTDEVEIETSKDMFEQFKKLAPMGHKKLRHYFPIEGSDLVWEVDIYVKDDGEYEQWCRCELEVTRLKDKIPDLPMEFKEVIECNNSKMTDEQKEKVDELYEKVFIQRYEENFLPLAT